jgi:hypothetical protein
MDFMIVEEGGEAFVPSMRRSKNCGGRVVVGD